MGSSPRSSVRVLAAVVLIGAASVPLLPSESAACSNVAPDVLAVRGPAEATEGEAPGPVDDVDVAVTRGVGPTGTGCGQQMESSCDDLGSVTLTFRPARDADSARDEVGYVVELAEGDLPEGLQLRAEPLLGGGAADEVSITWWWIDGRDDEQEPIGFAVSIHAVDADGHQGPRSAAIEVVDAGR